MIIPRENQLDRMTVGEKKTWLHDYGHLACYPRMNADTKSMVLWTSHTRVWSITEEADDMDIAIHQLFANVVDKLFRMTFIVENRMA